VLDLRGMEGIRLEMKRMSRAISGRRYPFLYLYGGGREFLLNSPAKVYLDHGKLARTLSEATGLPYQGRFDCDGV